MYPAFSEPGIFPEGRLHYLVLAACGDVDTSIAWNDYANALADDFPNEGEMRLFPLIADRLGGNLDEQPLAKYLNTTRRWARMQAMVNRQLSIEIGKLFQAADIPVMWTKGTALVARIDGRADLRPSVDLDALFQWEDTGRILGMADLQGWNSRLRLDRDLDRARYVNTEVSFDIGNHGQLDLQWQPRLPFAYDEKIQSWLWQDPSCAADINGIPYASDTWLMIETIEHGLNTNAVHPIRWLVDAVRLLEKRHATIDWKELTDIVIRNKLHYSFLIGLQTVARYSPHIPEVVFETLNQERVGYLDREEFRVRVSANSIKQGYVSALDLTRLRRAPSARYFMFPPNPLNRRSNLSVRARLAIAGRNIFTRLLFPLWYLRRS